MRTSSLDVTATLSNSTSTLSPCKLSVNFASLLSSLPSASDRDAIIREMDALVHWTKRTKIRWHIEMRRNILLQQGALGLAKKVDIDEAMRFVAAMLGEESGDTANSSKFEENKLATSTSASRLALRDQFAWGMCIFTLAALVSCSDCFRSCIVTASYLDRLVCRSCCTVSHRSRCRVVLLPPRRSSAAFCASDTKTPLWPIPSANQVSA